MNEKESNRSDAEKLACAAQEVRQVELGDKGVENAAQSTGERIVQSAAFSKVVNIRVDDIDNITPMLENLVDLSKKGLITDYVAVYYSGGEPAFALSYRARNRFRVIGMLQTVLQHLVDKFELV